MVPPHHHGQVAAGIICRSSAPPVHSLWKEPTPLLTLPSVRTPPPGTMHPQGFLVQG